MAKNNKNNKNEKKTTKVNNPQQTQAPKKPAAAPPKEDVVEEPEVIELEHKGADGKAVRETLAITKGRSGLSPDRQVDLLNLATRRFVENPDAPAKYGQDFVDKMDHITAVGIVATLAEEALNGSSSFAGILQQKAYPEIVEAAKTLGIKLPDQKLLASPVGKDGNVNENLLVVKKEDIEIPEAVAEEIKDEKKIVESGAKGEIEIDPKKVAHMGEEDATKALTFILIDNLKKHKSPKNALVEAVDFMQAYRLELAEQAENAGEAKEHIAERSMYEILSDVFKYVKPTIHLKGIGQGMHNSMCQYKSVLPAFLILRSSMTDKGSKKPDWDDQSIADATRALIELIANERLEKAKSLLAELDPKAKDFEASKASYNKEIEENNWVLSELANVSFDLVESTSEDALKAKGRILEQYYSEVDLAERPRWEGLETNIKQQAGIILNLFRAPGNKHQNYNESNIVEIKKLTLEEYEQKKAEQKKAELEAKKAESKNA